MCRLAHCVVSHFPCGFRIHHIFITSATESGYSRWFFHDPPGRFRFHFDLRVTSWSRRPLHFFLGRWRYARSRVTGEDRSQSHAYLYFCFTICGGFLCFLHLLWCQGSPLSVIKSWSCDWSKALGGWRWRPIVVPATRVAALRGPIADNSRRAGGCFSGYWKWGERHACDRHEIVLILMFPMSLFKCAVSSLMGNNAWARLVSMIFWQDWPRTTAGGGTRSKMKITNWPYFLGIRNCY